MRSWPVGIALTLALGAAPGVPGQEATGAGEQARGDAYVLAGEHGWSMSGSLEQLERLRDEIPSPFLWFRRGGKAYVVDDPATLERARGLFAPLRALDPDREALRIRQERFDERQRELENEQDRIEGRIDAIEDDREAREGEAEAESEVDEASDAGRSDAAIDSPETAKEREDLEARLRDVDARLHTLDPEERDLDSMDRSLDAREEKIEREVEAKLWRLIDESIQKGIARKSPVP